MPDLSVTVAGMLPGEAFAIKLIDLIEKVIDGQPPEVRKQLWEWYIEDAKAWRSFWGLKV